MTDKATERFLSFRLFAPQKSTFLIRGRLYMAPADEGAVAKRLRERVIRKRLPRRTPRNDATRDASSLIYLSVALRRYLRSVESCGRILSSPTRNRQPLSPLHGQLPLHRGAFLDLPHSKLSAMIKKRTRKAGFLAKQS